MDKEFTINIASATAIILMVILGERVLIANIDDIGISNNVLTACILVLAAFVFYMNVVRRRGKKHG